MDRKLIVLDVNGLMIHKVLSINDKEDINHLESYKTNKLNIYIRKGIYDFIKKLNETFDLAIWTSTNSYTLNYLINSIYKNTQVKFKFVWYRDRTVLRDINDKECYKTIKPVESILYNPVINYEKKYNKDNIIFVDDELDKISMNKNNCIIKEFDPYNEHNEQELDLIYEQILSFK